MPKTLPLSLLIVLAIGCASVKPVPCTPDIRVIEAPPRVDWIIPPAVETPPEIKMMFLEWTGEQIKADPSGYLEVLYSDMVMLETWMQVTRAYLVDLEAARQRVVIAAAEVHNDQPQ